MGAKGRAKPSTPSNPPPADTQFHFRFPRSSPTHESELGAAVLYRIYDATVLPALQVHSLDVTLTMINSNTRCS